LLNWISFLNNTCKIRRKLTCWNGENDALITRPFCAKELRIIVENLNLSRDFPRLENAVSKQKLFKDFQKIVSSISKRDQSVEEIKANAKAWHDDFETVWEPYKTPYIHLFGLHLFEFYEATDRELSCFTQQGHEKYNDFMTQHYFNATNRHANSKTHENDPELLVSSDHYLVQMLLRELRIQALKYMLTQF
jgi:hypothetical protein